MKAKLYLLPVTLGGNDLRMVIPDRVLEMTKRLRYFVVEDIRSARRYLRTVDNKFPLDEIRFFELNEHTRDNDIEHYLDPVLNGSDMGLMSEAGMPGIADPGSRLIAIAHRKMIPVVPLSGPSSVLLSLISSGLNGQKFVFHGYLPVKPADRASKLKELERSAGKGYSQIFIETPYRNNRMLDTILSVCKNDTLLCIAADLTLPTEFIRTMKISEWKNSRPDLNRRPAVYVMQ
ncbi:MAG: SAM-dependent methyltransferase [Bacteroidales bacterium]|nr:SAM-dependent methyltransferase [Bacteroidales bacterium]